MMVEDIFHTIFFESLSHYINIIRRVTTMNEVKTNLLVYFFGQSVFLLQGTPVFTCIPYRPVTFGRQVVPETMHTLKHLFLFVLTFTLRTDYRYCISVLNKR